MARHSLFPNSITVHYTSNGHSHNQVLPVGAIAGSAPAWTLPVRSGSPVDWRDAIEDYAAVMKALLASDASIDYADLYTYEATDSPAEFLASHPLGIAGTGSGPDTPYVQAVFPFKAIGGNSLRLTVLEGALSADQHLSYAGMGSGNPKNYVDWVLSNDDFIITRGGTFPQVSLGMTTKINDKLRKRYLLDS